MIIALTGFMGSSKTTVGRIVADALGCPFVDLDEAVVRDAGRSIPDIFAAEGEAGFREREWKALCRTVRKYGETTAVLSLGGGTLTLPGAPALLKEKTLCIYLQTSLAAIQDRLDGQTAGRPLAADGLGQRYTARLASYGEAADVTIDTDGLTPEQIADEIIISVL